MNEYIEMISIFDEKMRFKMKQIKELINSSQRLFFIGNGGSQAACSHLAEDFCKVANKPAMSLEGSSFITCLANDYGYEFAYVEWLKRFCTSDDLVVAISSSGKSANIVNALTYATEIGAKTVTLTAHKHRNPCHLLGDVAIHLPTKNYGVAECYHQMILHIILDEIVAEQ